MSCVDTFVGDKGRIFQLDYWVMQVLTSHGAFASFRVRLGKASCEACSDCGYAKDNAEHVLVSCPVYGSERRTLAAALGAPVEVSTLIGLATESEEKWNALRSFAEKAMTDRNQKEIVMEKEVREERARRAREEAAARVLLARRRNRKRKNCPSEPGANTRPPKVRRIVPPPPAVISVTPA